MPVDFNTCIIGVVDDYGNKVFGFGESIVNGFFFLGID